MRISTTSPALLRLLNFDTIPEIGDYAEKNCDCYIFKLRNVLGDRLEQDGCGMKRCKR